MNGRGAIVLMLAGALAACAHERPPVMARASASPALSIPHARVQFATASARMPVQGQRAIAENAIWLRRHPGSVLILEGHCDERGSDAFNLALGDRRARSVKGALVSEGGVSEEGLIVVSFGERRPLDPRPRPSAWKKNRRVEFIIR